MPEVGSMVLYGVHGVCKILNIEQRIVDRKPVEYLVLEPVNQPGAKFYIPRHNQAALSKLHPILTINEINSILTADRIMRKYWVDDESRRKQYYRDLLASGDRASLLCMVHNLHLHRKAQEEAGRKLHMCDETFLQDAQKLLRSEFSIILGIPENQVDAYIVNKVLENDRAD